MLFENSSAFCCTYNLPYFFFGTDTSGVLNSCAKKIFYIQKVNNLLEKNKDIGDVTKQTKAPLFVQFFFFRLGGQNTIIKTLKSEYIKLQTYV